MREQAPLQPADACGYAAHVQDFHAALRRVDQNAPPAIRLCRGDLMQIQSSFHHARFVLSRSVFAIIAILVTGTANAADASRVLWQATPARALPADAPPVAVYHPLMLDVATMHALLAPARHGASIVTLSLPHPDGSFSEFQLADSRTMPDELQDKFPDIVSLSGIDDHGRKARVDLTSQGFQAMVFEQDGVWVVRPESSVPGDRYMSFRRADLAVPGAGFQCSVHGDSIDASGQSLLPPVAMTTTGITQRVYRAAVAANSTYVAAVCSATPTVTCGLAAVVTAMNRVNQVYETELGVHMTLIANNNLIIYADAASDPYSNDTNALDENITNLNTVIGSANYDIGHVFTTGSGGVAELRATCTSDKAGGTTGLGNPVGDAFYIDYVAHEMGHQFGGNHTFNSNTSNCGGGNRAASAAYEPGSGSTIMAYAGICAADNLQPHSDPYFHAKSLDEINTWISGTGGACSVATASTDQLPVINTATLPNGMTLPMHTPFAMTGSATDADGGDAVTYNWEQYDLGAISHLAQGDIGNGPIFRSFNATSSGTRVFPKIETVLGAAFVKGETWPITTRNLNFRLTVRDNHNVPGTPQYGRTVSADTVIHVTSAAGPFVVTQPNTAITWGRGESHVVTWNVAGTSAAPVNCANVAIDLSNDGGLAYAFALAASEPNDGAATIVVPAVPDTNQARVRVSCIGNIFFDASDVNFNIAATGDVDPAGPIASVSPSSGLAFTLDAGATGSDTVAVANGGTAATSLAYTINESVNNCAASTNVAWLAASPTSGSVAGGSTNPVIVNINTATLAFGTYSASLCVNSNDAAHGQLVVPISLTVNQPANDEIFKDGFEPSVPAQPGQDG
jgi:Metallo-peptidase family M12B Reprolysin-like